ncbi:2177_t:CDS:2 [Rhizophagus irregularis]|nr:2177_t:CDS:2 [Rhizophagus irregularis]
MNHGDNVSENTSIISSSLCNGYENTKNSLDNNKKSIRDEICFVKSFRDLVKGSDGKIDNIKFGNVFSTKNKKNDYTFGQIEQNNGFVYPENSQNHFSPPQNHFSPPQIKENDNIINLPNSPNLYKEVTKGGSSTKVNGASFSNEFPRVRNDFVSSGQNGQHGQNGYYGQNGQHGLNGVHGQNGNKFGHVRFIRIIRNKNCAFAEFEEKECFSTAIESGYVTLNGLNLKINKTFRKKKEN